MRFFSTALLTIFISYLSIGQQKSKPIKANPMVSYAEYIGTTPEMRQFAFDNITFRSGLKKRRKPPANFPGRRKVDHQTVPGQPAGMDPVRQYGESRSASIPVEPEVLVDGIDRAFAGPRVPDNNGDIGRNYYVQSVNASFFQVFDKMGNEIGNPIDFNNLWVSLGFTSAGDPIVLYDQEFDRWIITEFPSSNQLLVAVSDTDDPLGTYKAWNFGTPRFPDYPKYGLWENCLYVTTNEGGGGEHIYFLDRADLMAGELTIDVQRIEIPQATNAPGFIVATPVDWTGPEAPPVGAQPMVMYIQDDAWGEVNQDQIDIFSFDVNFNDSDSTTWTREEVFTAPFDSDACADQGFGFACVPQQDGSGIDGIPYVIMHQTHYRNFGTHESIVLNFVVNASGGSDILAGIRWMELRRTGVDEPWTIYQEGTYSPDDEVHRFMGAIAQDGAGNIGLAFNVSNEDQYPGLRFTGRKASDPLGEMTIDEFVVAVGESATTDDRFGDYSSMAVDPINDRTFWFTGEYMKADNLWGTKVLAFQLLRDTIDMRPAEFLSPVSGADLGNENVQVRFVNFGLDTIREFVAVLNFDGNDIRDTVSTILLSDSSYTHTFSSTLDLSIPGIYRMVASSELIGDGNGGNDELPYTLQHIANIDAGIASVAHEGSFICDSIVNMFFELRNFGVDTLTDILIQIRSGGLSVDRIEWTGSLLFGESETLNYTYDALEEGDNKFTAYTTQPNGMVDEVNANDTIMHTVTAALGGDQYTFILQPDEFPEEITWELLDTAENVLYSGGPYTESDSIIVEWCLAVGCYTFRISDGYGDGICCQFGDGFYEIRDGEGNPIIVSNGDYGSGETQEFCKEECLVSAEIFVLPEQDSGASDGRLMIVPANGVFPYEYSLDRGVTWQFSTVFDELTSGIYEVRVRDSKGCTYIESIAIDLCQFSAMFIVNDESEVGAGDGSITIEVEGGSGAIMYSIDSGMTFQSDSIFQNMMSGLYSVVVVDDLGCFYSDTVRIDVNVGAENILGRDIFAKLYPNPSNGVSILEVYAPDYSELFLEYRMFNNAGKIVLTGDLVQYNGMYHGEIIFHYLPNGIYYMALGKGINNRLIKIVKK